MTPEELAAQIIPDLESLQSYDPAWLREVVVATIRGAVLEEREACAKIADSFKYPPNDVGRLDGLGDDAEAIAEEIRARQLQ